MKFGVFTTLLLMISNICNAATISCRSGVVYDTKKVTKISAEIVEGSAHKYFTETVSTVYKFGYRILIIKSPGGEVEEGARIIETMKLEKKMFGTKFVCIADEYAHSMAFNILSHCDIRLATPNAIMLVHKIRIQLLLPTPHHPITAANLRKLADDMDNIDMPYRLMNAATMHLSLEKYDFFADYETVWKAETLLQMHYLDDICTIKQ